MRLENTILATLPLACVLSLGAALALDALPLRDAGDSVGTVLGLHVEAISPDGAVVAERLDVETIAVGKGQEGALEGKSFVHETNLVLPLGSYSETGRVSSGFEGGCAYAACRPWVRRWTVEAAESVADLCALVGHLADIPGRKAILLLSEGITADPPMMAVNTIVANWGSQNYNLNVQKMNLHLGRDLYGELTEVHRLARANDVGFFTLDTREGAVDGFHGTLEHAGTLPVAALGVDAWGEMEGSTRRALDTLARETGGRSYLGLQDLEDNFRAAADGFLGMYTVGYYRTDPDSPVREVRVMIDRGNLEVSTSDRADLVRGPAAAGVYHE